MRKYRSLLFSLLCAISLTGQNQTNILDFEAHRGFPVLQGSDSLIHAWAGGLNGVNVNEIDLNLDNEMDLLLFDKNSNRSLTFVQVSTASGKQYRYAPEYEALMPRAETFIITADYNCDGKMDLFYNVGTRLYLWENTSNGSLSFTDPIGDYLQAQGSSSMVNVYVTPGDKPAIVDFDEDGDLDIISFTSGGSIIQYYENRANCGMDLKLSGNCWGNFSESGIYRSVNLGACNFFKKTLHSGSSILALDLNNDSKNDILLGNVSFPDVTALYNGGTNDSVVFTSQDTLFPTNDRPINVKDFAALSLVDVDFDGKPDLLASPYNEGSGNMDYKSLHLYKNNGSPGSPVFNFSSENFLQSEMIDLGTGAVPRLYDLNFDGRKDLVVANYEKYNPNGSPRHFYHYYQNTGKPGEPEFTLVDTNLADIGSLSIGLGSVPTFGDLNGDGIPDMIVGDQNGMLHYFTGSGFSGPNFSLQTAGLNGIDVGNMAAPFLFDLDDDGDLDLLVGNSRGFIRFYENSSATQPNFTLVSEFFGGVDTYVGFASEGRSIPYIYEQDSVRYLMIGSQAGGVMQYDSLPEIVNDPGEIAQPIGSGTLASSGYEETPLGSDKRNGRNQMLIRASELKAAGYTYGYITGLALQVLSNNNPTFYNGVTIRCKLTQDSVLDKFHTDLTEVRGDFLGGAFKPNTGWYRLDFTQEAFLWDGNSNLIVEMCFGGMQNGNNVQVQMTDVGFDANAIGNLVNNGLNNGLGCAQPYNYSITRRPNLRIHLTPALNNTRNLFEGVFYTAPALDDLNNDGFPDLIVGNISGGLQYYEGREYNIGLPEDPVVEDPSEPRLDIYPNPGRDLFTVVVENPNQARIRVFNLSGRLVQQADLTQGENIIDLSGQPRGLFLFVLENNEGVTTRKVIRQ